MMNDEKSRSSGATPERDGKKSLVNRAGLNFQGYSITSFPARQFWVTEKAGTHNG